MVIDYILVTKIFLFLIYLGGLKKNYCSNDTFHASCKQADQFILIRHALYGRMRVSECATEKYQKTGCSTNVIDLLDGICSGKKTCSIYSSDKRLIAMKPKACDKELTAYLEIQYDCVKIAPCGLSYRKLNNKYIRSSSS